MNDMRPVIEPTATTNKQATRLNIGCGITPTAGWKNYDNSWSVRLAGSPVLITRFLRACSLLSSSNAEFIEFVKRSDIKWADATRQIPEPNCSVEVVYSSHMIHWLDHQNVQRFLAEVRRVLIPGGILRLAVPDLRYHVQAYLDGGDADSLVAAMRLTRQTRPSFARRVTSFLAGYRDNQWMYDGSSLCCLLQSAGFDNPRVMLSGSTRIENPGELNLTERSPESVFVEAIKYPVDSSRDLFDKKRPGFDA